MSLYPMVPNNVHQSNQAPYCLSRNSENIATHFHIFPRIEGGNNPVQSCAPQNFPPVISSPMLIRSASSTQYAPVEPRTRQFHRQATRGPVIDSSRALMRSNTTEAFVKSSHQRCSVNGRSIPNSSVIVPRRRQSRETHDRAEPGQDIPSKWMSGFPIGVSRNVVPDTRLEGQQSNLQSSSVATISGLRTRQAFAQWFGPSASDVVPNAMARSELPTPPQESSTHQSQSLNDPDRQIRSRRRALRRRLSTGNLSYDELLELQTLIGTVSQGLSKSQIEMFPEEVFAEGMSHRECLICYTEYEPDERLRRLPCWHAFHCCCIDKWLQSRNTCPLCRFEVKQAFQAETGLPAETGDNL